MPFLAFPLTNDSFKLHLSRSKGGLSKIRMLAFVYSLTFLRSWEELFSLHLYSSGPNKFLFVLRYMQKRIALAGCHYGYQVLEAHIASCISRKHGIKWRTVINRTHSTYLARIIHEELAQEMALPPTQWCKPGTSESFLIIFFPSFSIPKPS